MLEMKVRSVNKRMLSTLEKLRDLKENFELTVKSSTSFHLSFAEDSGNLSECFGIVVRVEEGKSSGQEAKKDDSSRPDVES